MKKLRLIAIILQITFYVLAIIKLFTGLQKKRGKAYLLFLTIASITLLKSLRSPLAVGNDKRAIKITPKI